MTAADLMSRIRRSRRVAACENTIAAVTRMRGTAPELNPRATHVDGGMVRILDLTAAGYTLISP